MKDSYDQYSKEELLRILRERERRPKFGLVWERDAIAHDKRLNDDYVALKLDGALSCGDAPYGNMVIEGDNFDALRHLRMTHASRIKCIFIDPPYNTGNQDWVYNDRYVNENDRWRHSQWVEFLYQRLILAKELLTPDGVIMVCIDDDSRSVLELLMDEVFPGRRVGSFVWRVRSGGNDTKGALLSLNHEHVLVYANSGFEFRGDQRDESSYSNPDDDPRGDWTNDNLVKAHNAKQRPEAYYHIRHPETGVWYLCDPDSVWRFSSTTRPLKKKLQADPIETIISEKRILWPAKTDTVTYDSVAQIRAALQDGTAPKQLKIYSELNQLKKLAEKDQKVARLLEYIEPIEFWVGKKIGLGKPRYKRFRSSLKRDVTPLSSWLNPSADGEVDPDEEDVVLTVGATSEGTSLVKDITGNKDFPFPKPLSLVRGLIEQATGPDDIVLDFFAGSGTTAHAVLALNQQDGGSRRFILVSSTEATTANPQRNICRDICGLRVRRVIEGYKVGPRRIDGTGGGFAYLTATRIPVPKVFRALEHESIWLALQMIHDDAVTPYEPAAQVQWRGTARRLVVYVPKLNEDALRSVSKLCHGVASATVYAWQPAQLRQRLDAPHISFEQIPEYLMKRLGAPK